MRRVNARDGKGVGADDESGLDASGVRRRESCPVPVSSYALELNGDTFND